MDDVGEPETLPLAVPDADREPDVDGVGVRRRVAEPDAVLLADNVVVNEDEGVAVTLSEADADGDFVRVAVGVAEGPETVLVTDGDPEAERDTDDVVLTVRVALKLADTVGLREAVGDIVTDALGESDVLGEAVVLPFPLALGVGVAEPVVESEAVKVGVLERVLLSLCEYDVEWVGLLAVLLMLREADAAHDSLGVTLLE